MGDKTRRGCNLSPILHHCGQAAAFQRHQSWPSAPDALRRSPRRKLAGMGARRTGRVSPVAGRQRTART